MTLKGDEVASIEFLAGLLEKNQEYCRTEGKWEAMGLKSDNFARILALLESIGVIKEHSKTNGPSFALFQILPKATTYVRDIESQYEKKQAMLRIDSLQKELEEKRAKDEAFREEIRTYFATALAHISGLGMMDSPNGRFPPCPAAPAKPN